MLSSDLSLMEIGMTVIISKGNSYQQRDLIKIPYYAGWNIVAIKNVNWRYWTVTLQKPPKSLLLSLIKCTYEA
jgi:hypothetical protein